VDDDVATMTLLERLNDGGEVFLTHTTVGGRAVLRVAVGAPTTTRAHVERMWTLLREGHDWLAADFAAAAAERAAAQEAARARAEAERARAEAEPAAAEQPAEPTDTQPTDAEPTDTQPAQSDGDQSESEAVPVPSEH
jgi:aromatic-L-amino-acid decarboxylase